MKNNIQISTCVFEQNKSFFQLIITWEDSLGKCVKDGCGITVILDLVILHGSAPVL